MDPTTLLTKTTSTNTFSPNTISPNVALHEFPILESTQTTQDKNTSPANSTVVSWATLAHHKITMEPTIAVLTRQYCNDCKWAVHLTYS